MEYAICTVAAAPVRSEPNHRAEMVNQLLFGETMQVLEVKDEWFKIKSAYDGYEGWLTHHLVEEIGEETALKEHPFVASNLINIMKVNEEVTFLPMSSTLVDYDERTGWLWNNKFHFTADFRNVKKPFEQNDFRNAIVLFINVPYLWGGKTLMGIDCSGFTQVIFKLLGIKLFRDAYQQATQGEEIDFFDLQEMDLAFFQNEEGKIIHVGIVLIGFHIVHASGKVRIDEINPKGIRNLETGKRTHKFHSIRRMLPTVSKN